MDRNTLGRQINEETIFQYINNFKLSKYCQHLVLGNPMVPIPWPVFDRTDKGASTMGVNEYPPSNVWSKTLIITYVVSRKRNLMMCFCHRIDKKKCAMNIKTNKTRLILYVQTIIIKVRFNRPFSNALNWEYTWYLIYLVKYLYTFMLILIQCYHVYTFCLALSTYWGFNWTLKHSSYWVNHFLYCI